MIFLQRNEEKDQTEPNQEWKSFIICINIFISSSSKMSGSIFQGFEEQLNQTAEDILPYYWKNNTNGRHEYYKLFLMNLTS